MSKLSPGEVQKAFNQMNQRRQLTKLGRVVILLLGEAEEARKKTEALEAKVEELAAEIEKLKSRDAVD